MISIFLNSRNRVIYLRSLLDSIELNSYQPSGIEVLIAIDKDDQNSIIFSKIDNGYSFNIRYFINEIRPTNLHVSINRLAKESIGNYLFVLNDDTKILNYGWDKEINKVDHNKILYLRTMDNSCDKVNDKMYASFPILTRKAYACLGYFMSEKFVGLGGDAHLWRIFNSINRIVDVDVHIDHIFHRTINDVINPDDTAKYMRNNTWSNNIDPWNIDISDDINILRNQIND